MAATVKIARYNDSGAGASTDITSASLTIGTSDEATEASSIPIPSSGSNYSYWVHSALVATVAPDTQIDNGDAVADLRDRTREAIVEMLGAARTTDNAARSSLPLEN